MTPEQRKAHDAIADRLIAEGKLIAGGFEAFRRAVISPNAPQAQIDEMRNVWFAGAQHVYASIMTTLDEGDEPTEADMQRMTNIAAELDAYAKKLALRVAPAHRVVQ